MALISPQLPGHLSFVQVEMKTNRYWMAGQKSCKRLGLAHPHVQALLSERNHCLGDRTRESPFGIGSIWGGTQ